MLGLALALDSFAPPSSGGLPAWLPLAPDGSQPLLYADFKNGNYWASGAEVAAGDTVYENLDWAPFDLSQIVAGTGLTSASGSTGPTIRETPLGSTFVDGMTVVTSYRCSDAVSSNAGVYIQDFPNYDNSADVSISSNSAENALLEATGFAGATLAGAIIDGTNVLASNFTPDRAAASLNGDVVSAADITTTTPYNSLAIQPFSLSAAPNSAVLSIAVYVLQLETDLPAMSAV